MAQFQTALTMHQHEQLDIAEEMYKEILTTQPAHFESLLFLGHLLLQTGRSRAALDMLGKAIDINPDHASAHFDRGVALLNLLDYPSAIASFDQAIRLKPDYAEAFNNRGSAWQNQGEHEKAIADFNAALKLQPDNAFALNNKGISLQKLDRHDAAVACFEQAIALDGHNAATRNNRGVSLLNLGQYEDALDSFDEAVRIAPDYADAHINRGLVLPGLGRLDEALASFDKAIELNPGNALAHNDRGMALLGLARYEDAIAAFDKAIALRPDYFEAFNNRGLALPYLGRHEEALTSFEHAIDPLTDSFDARNNRGNVLRELRRHEEAIASYEKAIALRPNDPMVHYNEGMCRLQMGDCQRGWKKLEWRWQTSQYKSVHRDFPVPLWLGQESLQGKTILLHAEQGLGDTIQFCRYARLASDMGARVVLEVQPGLEKLLTSLDGVDDLRINGETLPEFDCHCPLLSLPLAFNTTLDTIPAAKTGYLRSDPALRAEWQTRLGERTRPRIGITWSGNRQFGNDRNRSIPLATLLPLLAGNAQFVSLQKEIRESDQTVLDRDADILHFGDELRDFSDTAALTDLMDLVISVDTSIAHLAGALGKPVWLLLPFNPDWRWLLDREDSPWYPSARLFRQSRSGDWQEVIERVAKGLATTFA